MANASEAPVDLKSHFIGALTIKLEKHVEVGATPAGLRNFAIIAGGTFEGPGIKASILPGGSDMLVKGADGAARPDVRLLVQTDDGATILVAYRGIRVVEAGKADYWRCLPLFETASDKYGWLNRIVSVSFGRMVDEAIVYDIFRID
jgi:hypothetical protein